MKKIFTIAAVAAVVLSSCAKVDNYKVSAPEAISFGVYVPKTATKAGAAGTITQTGAESTTSLQTVGFGVFAYYTDGDSYPNANTSLKPNFMYNTKVSGAAWEYAPIKYWPNETIDDSNDAYGPAAADRLSFFAYAPHVGLVNDATNGNDFDGSAETTGITELTSKSTTSDPKVTYAVSTTPDTAVDLLWAVAPVGGFSYTDVHGETVSVAEGMPLKNLTKPNTTEKISFRFRHATARLGLKIIGAFDKVPGGQGTLDDKTKVTVEKVELVDVPVFTTGILNLNNTVADTPEWESLGSATATTFTVEGANLNAEIKDSGSDAVQTVAGVTSTEKNVFKDVKTFFTLIPVEDVTTVRVKITYYVTTEDKALDGGFSRVKNVIYKDITFGDDTVNPVVKAFEAGKAYTIKIILGLTSVKLEADVEDWDNVAAKEVDLPINK